MQDLVEQLKKRHLTLASCESLTGGRFASKVVDVSGASQVFLGALVTYAPELKIRLAKVDEQLILTHGVVSAEVAKAMAMNTRDIIGSDIAVSFTGNAGPQATENKPVGLVYSAIATDNQCLVFEDHLLGSRDEIRNQVIAFMKQRLMDFITN